MRGWRASPRVCTGGRTCVALTTRLRCYIVVDNTYILKGMHDASEYHRRRLGFERAW